MTVSEIPDGACEMTVGPLDAYVPCGKPIHRTVAIMRSSRAKAMCKEHYQKWLAWQPI